MENQTRPPEGEGQTLDSNLEHRYAPERPILLTVICIISFVFLGWAILQGILSLILGKFTGSFYAFYQNMLEKSMNDMGDVPPALASTIQTMMDSILKLIEHAPTINAVTLICSLIALGGVIMMWNLKKNGFILYVVPKVFLVFFPVLLVGFNFITAFALFFGVIFSGVFIVLYAVNLKVMK